MQSRSRESGLWNWLLGGAPADAVMERIENVLSAGTPDAMIMWRAGCVVELKSVPRRPGGDVWCELKSEQASFLRRWHRAGGLAWVLVQVGVAHDARRYLINAADCHELLRPLPEAQLALMSASHAATPRQCLEAMCQSTR